MNRADKPKALELGDIGFSRSAKVDKNDQGGEKNVREHTALTQKGTFIMGVYGRTEFVGDGARSRVRITSQDTLRDSIDSDRRPSPSKLTTKG